MSSCLFSCLALCGHSVVTLLWRGDPNLHGTPSWSIHVYLCCGITGLLLSLAVGLLPRMDNAAAGWRCLPLASYTERGAEYTALGLSISALCTLCALIACVVAVVGGARSRRLRYESRDLGTQIVGVAIWIPCLCVLTWAFTDPSRRNRYYMMGPANSAAREALGYLLVVHCFGHLAVNIGVTVYLRFGRKSTSSDMSATRTDGDGLSNCSMKKRGIELSASSTSPDSSMNSDFCTMTFDVGCPPTDFLAAKQLGPATQIQVFNIYHLFYIYNVVIKMILG